MDVAVSVASFIDALRQIGNAIWPDLKKVGGTVLGEVARGMGAIVNSAKEFVNAVVTGYTKGRREPPATAREQAERDLQEVNAEIVQLRQRYIDQGGLNDQQKRRWANLKARRDEINNELSAIDQFVTAAELTDHERDFKPVRIDDANAQILQYHVGQNACNKICRCGRPMVLQWDRRKETAGLQDFFWGCSGYYIEFKGKRACTHTQQLTTSDFDLFTNLNRPEFKLDSLTLTRETINPVKAHRIRQALDSIRGKHSSRSLGIAVYRCPIHGESLRLKRNREPSGQLLDEYFLGCPRWLPNNAGCNFLVKLKSAAQISSVLDREQSVGVLGV